MLSHPLSILETRIIGCLVEKSLTTPDQYPLSLNALTNACNQKSNREPILNLTENEVQDGVETLESAGLVSAQIFGSRVAKYQHRFCNTEFSQLKLTAQELGLICVLFLRGPQTPGELRTRTNRLCTFAQLADVEAVLEGLAGRPSPLVMKLEREPGKREARYAHLFCGEHPVATPQLQSGMQTEAPEQPLSQDLAARVEALEEHVQQLQKRFEELESLVLSQ